MVKVFSLKIYVCTFTVQYVTVWHCSIISQWIPMLQRGKVQVGEFNLAVAADRPPHAYSQLSSDVPLPNLKWIDGHKSVFKVNVSMVSSIHPKVREYEEGREEDRGGEGGGQRGGTGGGGRRTESGERGEGGWEDREGGDRREKEKGEGEEWEGEEWEGEEREGRRKKENPNCSVVISSVLMW